MWRSLISQFFKGRYTLAPSTSRVFSLSSACTPSAFLFGHRGFAGNHPRAFSSEDEVKLNDVMRTNPRMVAAHIRQSMQNSRKRAIHFRNCVTYATIILQSKLHSKSIAPTDASAVVESLLSECAALRQGDMAHLLVRAALRFKKFGVVLRPSFAKLMFQSYRGNAQVQQLLREIGEELKGADCSFSSKTALILGGDSAVAIQREDLRSKDDVLVLIECYALMSRYDSAIDVLADIVSKPGKFLFEKEDISCFLSMAINVMKESAPHIEKIIQLSKANQIIMFDGAAAVLLSRQMGEANSLNQVEAEEQQLLQTVLVEEKRPLTTSVVVTKCSELIIRNPQQLNLGYLSNKVEALVSHVEQLPKKKFFSTDDTGIFVAVLKGHGALGKLHRMNEFFNIFQDLPIPNEYKLYEEVLRWHTYNQNATEVIRVKELMSEKHIYHTVHSYQYLFRALDIHYLKLVENYYHEMRNRRIKLDGFITPLLIRAFSEMKKYDVVEALYLESKSHALNGVENSVSPKVVVQMLRCFRSNLDRCKAIIADAEKLGLLSDSSVQAEYLTCLSSSHQQEELDRFLSRVSSVSPHIYRVLLRNAAKKRNRTEFDAMLTQARSREVWDERMMMTVITALAQFSDPDGVKEYVQFSKEKNIITTSFFYAEVASAFSLLGNLAEMDNAWISLLNSKITISTSTYNRFLDIFMEHNNIAKVQEVLDTMMQLIPPNPVTATTVIDVLGKMGRLDELEAVLESMTTSLNVNPTLRTLHTAMSAFAKVGNVNKMEEIRRRITLDGYTENHITYNILFEGYGKAKRFERLHELLRERQHKKIDMDEAAYVILLNIFTREKMAGDIEALVQEMISSGASFSNRLLSYVANAFASVNNTSEMEKYVQMLLVHPGCSSRDSEMVYSIYAKHHDTAKIQELLDNPKFEKTNTIYNTSIAAFAKAGEYSKVGALLAEMEKKNFSLNKPTSILLSSLLVKAGKPELAQSVLTFEGVDSCVEASSGEPFRSEGVGGER